MVKQPNMSNELPNVLVLGGLGMIGRNFLMYIINFELCSFVRVVDKQVPGMAYLSTSLQKVLQHEKVEVVQADVSVSEHAERAFAGVHFSLVINLASETQYGHFDSKYERNILQLRTLCARIASIHGVEKYIEVSTSQVYDGVNDKKSTETSKLKPWTAMAKYHLAAENAIREFDLPFVILRLPIVYGPGDIRGLMPRIICAAVYEYTQEKMEFLWGEDLRMNTVHVQDAAASIWHLCCAGEVGETYNLVDENDTSQGKFNSLLESMFQIQTGFYGTIMSNLAQLKLEELVDEANDGHLTPWNAMLRAAGISVTPLNPYLEKELLYNNPLSIDGSKLKNSGFQCSCPFVTPELLADSLKYWKDLGLFPQKSSK
jgi:nucleoside-diphosphate-sugar epimerase